MNPLLHDLDRLVAQGAAFTVAAELGAVELQEWLNRRSRLFANLDAASVGFGGDELDTFESLIGEIVGLDAVILAKVETEKRQVGAQLEAAQKLKNYLSGGVNPASHALLRRMF